MKTIFKYGLEFTDSQTLLLPEGAKILSVGNQMEKLCLWALLDPAQSPKARTFRIYGTGHPVPQDGTGYFLGTVQFGGGTLVMHVFEVTP